jgi:hypothetical protein
MKVLLAMRFAVDVEGRARGEQFSRCHGHCKRRNSVLLIRKWDITAAVKILQGNPSEHACEIIVTVAPALLPGAAAQALPAIQALTGHDAPTNLFA